MEKSSFEQALDMLRSITSVDILNNSNAPVYFAHLTKGEWDMIKSSKEFKSANKFAKQEGVTLVQIGDSFFK